MATGGLYLFRRLEQLLPGVVSKPYRRLKFYEGMVVPTIADLQAGAAEVVRESLSEVGDAAIVSDGAVDIPVVDISSDEERYRVLMFASAFSFTMQQMRAIEAAGNAQMVSARKQALAMRSIAERVNTFTAYGNTGLGLTGFLNNADVTADDNSTNLYTATPDVLAEFFIEGAAAISVAEEGTFEAADVLVSHDIYVLLSSTRMTDGSMNVLNYILLNSGGLVRSVQWASECGTTRLTAAGVGETDKDRIVFYPFERMAADVDDSLEMDMPEILERHVEPVQVAPQDYWEVKNLRQVVPMFMCTTPTMINYPQAMAYVDVPKKA